ncbi:MAG: SIMPL domain-containing protein, partial [Candidatus Obscuribacterales bacterium]|nr:SIMPL domain-containing protein [Steroidobacteraceae bacterium]
MHLYARTVGLGLGMSLSLWLLAMPSWGAERTVAVTGLGEVLAEPDRASVSLGIEARKPQLEAARTEVGKGVDAILKLTRELKIDAKNVRTTRLNVQPEYDWNNPTRQRRLIGYYVMRQVEIDLRDLEQ